MPSVNPSAIPSAHPAVPALPADVVVFGEALVDMFPEKPGVPLEEVDRFVRYLGGAPCNLAVNLSRQGLRVALCIAQLSGSTVLQQHYQQQYQQYQQRRNRRQ